MKLYKFMPLALLAALATGCSQAGPDPDAISPGSFFPTYNTKAFKKCAPDEEAGVFDNSFQVQVCRTSNTVGQKVGLSYTVKVYDEALEDYVDASNDLFTVPSEIVYSNNQPMTYVDIVAHNELLEEYVPVLLTLTLADKTDFGSNVMEVQYQRVPWYESYSPAGNLNMADGWIMPGFGLDPFAYSFDCEFQINDINPLMFRLVNPYQSKGYFAPLAAYNIANTDVDYYVNIDLTNPDYPAVEPSVSGFYMDPSAANWGMLGICNFEGYVFAAGGDTSDIDMEMEPEERSTFTNNTLSIPVPMLYLDADSDRPAGPYANPFDGPGAAFTFPPNAVVFEDGKAISKVKPMKAAEANYMRASLSFAKQLHLDLINR